MGRRKEKEGCYALHNLSQVQTTCVTGYTPPHLLCMLQDSVAPCDAVFYSHLISLDPFFSLNNVKPCPLHKLCYNDMDDNLLFGGGMQKITTNSSIRLAC